MYEFNKDSKGEVTEGYLGNPEDFNGVVFLLREPNNKDKNNPEFWFKKVLYDLEGYCQKQKEMGNNTDTTKRAATRYINRFSEMLIWLEKESGLKAFTYDLKKSVYCNVHPEFGEKRKTKEYDEVTKERSKKIINGLSDKYSELIIFTCCDIYNNLKNLLNPDKENDGLKYAKQRLSCFEAEYNSCHIKIYEIYHPSYGSSINTSP